MSETLDYTYDSLLNRVYEQIEELSQPKKIKVKPPIINKKGKKTYWSNFTEICKILNRDIEHVKGFLFAELGCGGSIDGVGGLNIDGKYQQIQIENMIKKYIKEYIICNTCKSPNTNFVKDARVTFLTCSQCKSQRKINSIQQGFQATTKAQRIAKRNAEG